jgi:hypothetical protein
MSQLTLVFPLLGLVAVVGCAARLDESECDQLLDHYTARLLLEEQPQMSDVEVERKQQQARQLARETPRFEFQRCSELVSRTEFECALSAPSVDSIERCLL